MINMPYVLLGMKNKKIIGTYGPWVRLLNIITRYLYVRCLFMNVFNSQTLDI